MTVGVFHDKPEEFADLVKQRGGRVDFVFEEDRPFKECHASTLIETAEGSLLCAWFGGTKEKHRDVAIWLARFSTGSWSPPVRVAKISDIAHWNPVLFRDEERVYLFFKVGKRVSIWQTYWMSSPDQGSTWSSPVELVPGDIGGRGPVKNKPIMLSDGAWLAPASTELGGWRPFADRSEDRGKTWVRSGDFAIDRNVIRGTGAIQPTFWESAPGQVHALMRTSGGVIARSDSSDGGRSWCAAYATDLPNNNSGIDLVRLEDGRVVLVYNPVRKDWGPRTPLCVALSEDDGATWEKLASLETDLGEYSYPAIVKTTAGVAISYTWRRQRIRCWQMTLPSLAG